MNDLFSSFKRSVSGRDGLEMAHSAGGGGGGGINLDKFFEDVESIKSGLGELEAVQARLQSSHEKSKALHDAKAIRELRAEMDADVAAALKKANLIKGRLEALDKSNAAELGVPGCGPGSASDRTRTSVVNGLRKKLKASMEGFSRLRQQISDEYRETVQRRYFTVTGENPDERTLDILISTGESETFLRKAIQEQGRGQIVDTIQEIQERHDAVKEIEKNLKDLHQVFMDMAVLVETQGGQIDDIESQVGRALSMVQHGNESLQAARAHQKNTRKWTCYGIIILLIVILLIVLFLVRPWN